MKNLYKQALIKTIQASFKETRKEILHISQDEMSEKLLLSCRSYIELEHGKSICNSLSLVLYLIYYCPDTVAFLDDAKKAIEKAHDSVA